MQYNFWEDAVRVLIIEIQKSPNCKFFKEITSIWDNINLIEAHGMFLLICVLLHILKSLTSLIKHEVEKYF